MTVLVVSDRYYPEMDGVVKFIEEVVPRLKKQIKLSMIVPNYQTHKRKLNIPTTEIPSWRLKHFDLPYIPIPKKLKKLKQAIKNSNKVWIQTMGLFGILAFHYAKKYKKPVYIYVHSIEWELLLHTLKAPTVIRKILSKITKKIIRNSYKKANLLMVPSQKINSLFPKLKTKVIPLGVDTNIFKPKNKKNQIFTIGFCGRLSKEKNLLTLKKAFEMFNEKVQKSKLLLIGDGSLRTKLKAPNTKITGFVYNPAPYFQEMDAFVLPSLTETTSLATLEAMSSGVPAIVTKTSPVLSRIIQDGKNGFFFNSHNARQLRDKLLLLNNKPKLRKKIGGKGRKIILKDFSWDRTVKKIAKILS